MTIADRVAAEMKEAMRARDKVRLTVLRALKTALTNAAIEKGGLGTELDAAEGTAVVRKQLKQRQDAASQFRKADRPELAETEEAEISVLKHFLPQPLSEAELEALIDQCLAETGASSRAEMGQVMKCAQEKAAGRADGKILAGLVGKKLA